MHCTKTNSYCYFIPNFIIIKLLFIFLCQTVNRSPAKNVNGRDNTESIDMEMSDEDAGPEFGGNLKLMLINLCQFS